MARYGYNPASSLQPISDRQIRSRVLGQLRPYLRSGHYAIQAYTHALADALAPAAGQTQAIYGRAQSQQAAVDQALANRLTGAGQAAQKDVAAQLQQAGQNTAPAQALGQVGTGAANAGYASGSADQSRLIAQGAAASNYAGNLPNIARLGGAQQEQQYQASIMSQLPKLLQAEQDRNFQRAVAAQSGLIQTSKMNQQASQFSQRQNQQAGQFQQRQQQQQNQFLARLRLSQSQLALAQKHERAYEAGKKGGKGGFTPTQVSKFKANSIEAVKEWKHGRQNPYYDPSSAKYHNGVADKAQWVYQPRAADRRGALRSLILHGVPPSIASWAVGQVYGATGSTRGRGNTGPR